MDQLRTQIMPSQASKLHCAVWGVGLVSIHLERLGGLSHYRTCAKMELTRVYEYSCSKVVPVRLEIGKKTKRHC